MKKNLIQGFTERILPLTVVIILLGPVSSCGKENDPDPVFDDISLNDIKAVEADMIQGDLVISDSEGVQWQTGDILFYRTNQGRYGKFEVISVDAADNYLLTIKAVTYDNGGTVYSQTAGLAIRGTWLCDLDNMEEMDVCTREDFHNNRINVTDTRLTPLNDALFMRYTF